MYSTRSTNIKKHNLFITVRGWCSLRDPLHPWPFLRPREPHLQLPRQRLWLQGPVGVGGRVQVPNSWWASSKCCGQEVTLQVISKIYCECVWVCACECVCQHWASLSSGNHFLNNTCVVPLSAVQDCLMSLLLLQWMNETFILFSTITIVNEKQLYDKNETKKVLHNIIGYITD